MINSDKLGKVIFAQNFQGGSPISINRLYHTWFLQIRQLWPNQRVTRVRLFAWLLVGIFRSRSVQLWNVALEIPGTATEQSVIRRLSRFLDNPAVLIHPIYEPIARAWLLAVANGHQGIRLIVDGTKVGFGYQLLIVSIAYRKRAIPIAWIWQKGKKGHSSAHNQLALLTYVAGLLPAHIPVLLVGDSEFGAVPVLRQLDAWRWHYVLRQKANNEVRGTGQDPWQAFGRLVQAEGQSVWLGAGWLTARHAYPVHLLAHWEAGYPRAWLLATNFTTRQATLKAYRLRMWIEEMFGDLKKHGFDLESTHLLHPDRLSRLTLAVVLLYLWLMQTGTRTIKDGHRYLVDRKDRRDLSLFQIGLRWIRRLLKCHLPFPLALFPGQSSKLSGG